MKKLLSILAITLPIMFTLSVQLVLANEVWDGYGDVQPGDNLDVDAGNSVAIDGYGTGEAAAPSFDPSGADNLYAGQYPTGELSDVEEGSDDNLYGEPYEENEEELYDGEDDALDEGEENEEEFDGEVEEESDGSYGGDENGAYDD